MNYANAEVFRSMAEEMLFLANQGVEVLRLDAVAFIWKRLGTNCENQPEAHTIIRAFNAMARIVAPCMTFKKDMVKLTNLRKNIPAFQNGGMEVISTGNPHLFGYIRAFEDQKIMILNNFSDRTQKMDGTVRVKYCAKNEALNLLRNENILISGDFLLGGYQPVGWIFPKNKISFVSYDHYFLYLPLTELSRRPL